MPIQNYGAIMGDAAQAIYQPARVGMIANNEMQNRNALLGLDQQKFQAVQQQQADAKAQADQEEAQWERALASQDWGTMARIDPHATQLIMLAKGIGQKGQQQVEPFTLSPGSERYKTNPDGTVTKIASTPFAPANDKVVLVGGVPTMVDPRSHETTALSTLPNEIAGKGAIAAATAGAQTTAKAQATAAQSIPDVQTNASLMNKTLDDFEKSPGMRFLYGGYAYAPIVPGTPQADASGYLDQIVGGSFLQAYNTLRGGGQITEVEGKKATAAITRLQNRNISYGSAKQAINDLRQVIKAGVTKAQTKAGSAAPSNQNDPLGIR